MVLTAQRLVIFLLFAICYLLFAITPSFAQGIPSRSLNINPDVPNDFHTYSQSVVLEIMAALSCQITGVDPLSQNKKCLGFDTQTGKIGYVENNGGAIGLMGNMIAMTYSHPVHTSDYIRYMAGNFGISKPAYAQTGFDGLTPLLKLWTIFRNIVYMLFVVVFVGIGFAIMLRIKIDPRTVMTIENQIPKVIISLILVTFSFAIAGFLIDLMYLLIYMLFNLANSNNLFGTKSLEQINNVQIQFNGQNPIGIFNQLFGFTQVTTSSAGGVKDVVLEMFSTDIPGTKNAGALQTAWALFTNPSETILNAFGFIMAYFVGIIAIIIIGVAILWAMFRLWFTLITSFIYVLIDIVLAPFWILAGAIPGSTVGFGLWLRDIIAYLSPFPVTIAMFLFGKILIEQFGAGNATHTFIAPLIGNTADMKTFGNLIGLGIILMTPQVVQITKDALKAPSLKYTAAIGQAVGVGAGFPAATGKGTLGTIMSAKETIVKPGGAYEPKGYMKALGGRVAH